MADSKDAYIDGWLICFSKKGIKRYQVRPGTCGIADCAFDWSDVEELVIPSSVKHIGRINIKIKNRVYETI